jgi:hypothetical protein
LIIQRGPNAVKSGLIGEMLDKIVELLYALFERFTFAKLVF